MELLALLVVFFVVSKQEAQLFLHHVLLFVKRKTNSGLCHTIESALLKGQILFE